MLIKISMNVFEIELTTINNSEILTKSPSYDCHDMRSGLKLFSNDNKFVFTPISSNLNFDQQSESKSIDFENKCDLNWKIFIKNTIRYYTQFLTFSIIFELNNIKHKNNSVCHILSFFTNNCLQIDFYKNTSKLLLTNKFCGMIALLMFLISIETNMFNNKSIFIREFLKILSIITLSIFVNYLTTQ